MRGDCCESGNQFIWINNYDNHLTYIIYIGDYPEEISFCPWCGVKLAVAEYNK